MAALLSQAEELFIDSSRLLFWTSGHGTTLPLTMVMDEDFPWHDSVRGPVCGSPVMKLGDQFFQFRPEDMAGDFPIFIATAEKDSFYEVRRSVELFCEAARGIDREVTRQTCSGTEHHWMHLDSLDEDAVADEDALRLAEEMLKFVKRVI
jgi:acetyl esterase/lipase